MVEQKTRELIAEKAIVHTELPLEAKIVHALPDRNFNLPTGLYAATVALFLGFIAVTGLGFSNPEMILPVAIFALFIVAGFGVPAIWTRLTPESEMKAAPWSIFRSEGIQTHTGRNTAGQASVQVLILPVLIFVWGLTAVAIAAVVG